MCYMRHLPAAAIAGNAGVSVTTRHIAAGRRAVTAELAAMRQEYAAAGSTEEDLAADLARPSSPPGSPRRSRRACPSRTRWCWPPPTPTAGPARARCCSRAYDRRGFDVLHQLRLPQGPRAARPTRTRAWSSPGTRCSARSSSAARSSGSPGRRPRRTSPIRPRESQLGAWASPQSQVIAERAELERPTREVARGSGARSRRRRTGAGCGVVPETVEFWQGRPAGCTTASGTGEADGWLAGGAPGPVTRRVDQRGSLRAAGRG